ncbi:paralemmin-3 [Cheilinus undulatus]|uniref:paralemmin-3 n=1 Tax=Cheilinus undulatus TaxID=241271 RepID=UPI001BD30026|nr:paralemmin-3 [Cheilinus undulatus]XP_041642156.1 paralemmin-3 [Cheilinus undulatus]
MDETEKYKQRLEAIAEKRRLQEEQDKARREMEDERLRLQQLKRKSLRDQWLMEGAPLSPTSPDGQQSPRSPLWGFQPQEVEKHQEKLESESQQLAEEEEEEKLKEQMEDGQSEAVKKDEATPEMIQDAVLQNGDNNSTGLGTEENKEKTDKSQQQAETVAVLTNGQAEPEATTNHNTLEEGNQPITNGPVTESEDVINTKQDSTLNLGEAANVNTEEEDEEEGTVVMRAECVIITDEGDDVPEDLSPQEDQQETIESEESPLKPSPEAGEEGGEAVKEEEEEELVIEAASETLTRPEQSEATAEAQQHSEDRGTKETEGQDNQAEDPASVQLQCTTDALEGTAVAPVPVYSEVQASTLTPKLEAEGEELTEGAEAVSQDQDQDSASQPGQFQEVSLADPQESSRTEAGPGEQEPLLSQAKAPNTQTEPAAANSPDSSDTNVPTRNAQGEEIQAPKRKTCQCCSVM